MCYLSKLDVNQAKNEVEGRKKNFFSTKQRKNEEIEEKKVEKSGF